MTAIIRHFGDTADAHRPCGHRDVCSPATATAQSYRPPTPEDPKQFSYILQELDDRWSSTGKLYTALAAGALRGTAAGKDRKASTGFWTRLARRAGLPHRRELHQQAEGNVIPYKKVSLTHEGREAVATGTLQRTTISSCQQPPKTTRPKSGTSNTSGHEPLVKNPRRKEQIPRPPQFREIIASGDSQPSPKTTGRRASDRTTEHSSNTVKPKKLALQREQS